VQAELLVLLGRLHSGKQLLPNQPDDGRSSFSNQFGQLRNDQLFCRVYRLALPPQRQGPHGGINQHLHQRLAARSRL